MTTDRNALSLPETVGEQTLVAIEETVAEATQAEGRGTQPGLFKRCELKKGQLLYGIDDVPDAIYMLRGGAIRLKVVDGRPAGAKPVQLRYEAVPNQEGSQPILGARYFFTRSRVSLAYEAQTACSVYRIDSKALRTMYEINTENVLLITYWMLVCSDISDVFVPRANKLLTGQASPPVETTQELFRAVDEFRTGRSHPRMQLVLTHLYDKFVSKRRERGEELGLELSVP